MDNVTLNIFLALLISFFILGLAYLGIMLIIVPYWDKKDKKEKEKKSNETCSPTTQNTTLKRTLKSGDHASTLEQDGISYQPYFDKEKGLYIPMIFAQRNIVYYQLIPLNILSDVHNYFAEEINESLMKNNKDNDNKENNNG